METECFYPILQSTLGSSKWVSSTTMEGKSSETKYMRDNSKEEDVKELEYVTLQNLLREVPSMTNLLKETSFILMVA